jgi:hypothetical protein
VLPWGCQAHRAWATFILVLTFVVGVEFGLWRTHCCVFFFFVALVGHGAHSVCGSRCRRHRLRRVCDLSRTSTGHPHNSIRGRVSVRKRGVFSSFMLLFWNLDLQCQDQNWACAMDSCTTEVALPATWPLVAIFPLYRSALAAGASDARLRKLEGQANAMLLYLRRLVQVKDATAEANSSVIQWLLMLMHCPGHTRIQVRCIRRDACLWIAP